jgi:hypothetical protein
MSILSLTGFRGANTKADRYFLPADVGVMSLNQKPSDDGVFRPWREPLTIAGPVMGSSRQTIYRMGREAATPAQHWLTFTTLVHLMRGFEDEDTTERTYFTGAAGGPQWTSNLIGLSSAPYPSATRKLGVPQPTVAPGVALVTDGPTGTERSRFYCFTWVNDIGWESAPSPAVKAAAAKPGAVFDLTISESVPAGNYNVTLVRWYVTQTGANSDTEFYFLREYAVGATGMQDDGRELNLRDGALQADGLWLELDASATWLTPCWEEVAACIVGKTVRFCVPGLIYAWPIEFEYVVTNGTPLALAAFGGRLLALTSAGGELFTGSIPDQLAQKPMALAVLVSQRSVVTGENFAIWAANDGLWYYDASGNYRNLVGDCMTPAQWQALVPSTIAGYYCELGEGRPLYVGFYNDGSLKGFVVDPRNPNGIYMLSTGYAAGYWDPLLRALFVLDGTTLKQWDAGAAFMSATFRGKVERQQSFTEGEWLEVLGTGNIATKVWTEDRAAPTTMALRYDRTIERGEHRLPDGIGGRDWQVEVVTTGEVHGVVAE